MHRHLRIAVADDEPDMQEYFEKILPRMGHEVLSVSATGRQLVECCRRQRPDLVITDILMPDMDGIQAAQQLYKEGPLPVILVTAHHDSDSIRRAQDDHIMAYLVKPIKQADLQPAIAIAMHRFEQFNALRQEADDLLQALEDRKLIERAKGMLMKRTGMDEPAAFRRLQQLASAKNIKLVEVARTLAIAEEALAPPKAS